MQSNSSPRSWSEDWKKEHQECGRSRFMSEREEFGTTTLDGCSGAPGTSSELSRTWPHWAWPACWGLLAPHAGSTSPPSQVATGWRTWNSWIAQNSQVTWWGNHSPQKAGEQVRSTESNGSPPHQVSTDCLSAVNVHLSMYILCDTQWGSFNCPLRAAPC